MPRAPGPATLGRAGQLGAGRLGHHHARRTTRISAAGAAGPEGRAEPARRRARRCSWPAARRRRTRRRSTPAAASWPCTGSRSPRSTRSPASRCRRPRPARSSSVGGGGRLLATDTTFSDLGSPADGSRGGPARRRVRRRQQRLAGAHRAAAQQHRAAAERQLRGPPGGRADRRVGGRTAWCCAATRAPGCARCGPSATPATACWSAARARSGRSPASAPPATARSGSRWSGRPRRGSSVCPPGPTGAGGLQLSGGADAAVSGFTAVDQPIGVLTHAGAARVGLGDLRIAGGERGVVVEQTTAGLAAERVPDRGCRGRGRGRRAAASGVQRCADRRQPRPGCASNVAPATSPATALTVTGGQDGVVVPAPAPPAWCCATWWPSGWPTPGCAPPARTPRSSAAGSTAGSTGIAPTRRPPCAAPRSAEVEVGIRARSAQPVAAEPVRVSAAVVRRRGRDRRPGGADRLRG